MSKRHLQPGGRDRRSIARPLPQCTGGCLQGRAACDCATGMTELACELGPDASRVIQPPIRTPEDMAAIARVRRWSVVIAVMAFSALAALLGIADARWQP